jgi:hypothetical protein
MRRHRHPLRPRLRQRASVATTAIVVCPPGASSSRGTPAPAAASGAPRPPNSPPISKGAAQNRPVPSQTPPTAFTATSAPPSPPRPAPPRPSRARPSSPRPSPHVRPLPSPARTPPPQPPAPRARAPDRGSRPSPSRPRSPGRTGSPPARSAPETPAAEEPPPRRAQPRHHAGRRIEPEGRAARQHQRIHRLDRVLGRQKVRLPRPRRAAHDMHRRHEGPRRRHHRHAGLHGGIRGIPTRIPGTSVIRFRASGVIRRIAGSFILLQIRLYAPGSKGDRGSATCSSLRCSAPHRPPAPRPSPSMPRPNTETAPRSPCPRGSRTAPAGSSTGTSPASPACPRP